MSSPATSAAHRVRFTHDGPFHHELKQKVDAYFERTGQQRRDLPRMYLKTLVIIAWFGVSWALLVFAASSWWLALPLAVSLGLAVSAIGMSVMHDANHGAYSSSTTVNRLVGWTLDAMGASSFIWKQKHNVVHHTFTNVDGVDDDLDMGALGRLTRDQPLRPVHRFQHAYMWVLYGFLLPKWVFFDDFSNLASGRVGHQKLPRLGRGELVALLAGKVTFVAWALLIPAIWHPLWVVALLALVMCFTTGVTLAVTFQLAHCVEEADFQHPAGDTRLGDWAVHQLATTVDFARDSRALTWFMGGLNFQVVHHLFPRICHLHYPALSHIVDEVAAAHGLRYRTHRTLSTAIRSHYRMLRTMGAAA